MKNLRGIKGGNYKPRAAGRWRRGQRFFLAGGGSASFRKDEEPSASSDLKSAGTEALRSHGAREALPYFRPDDMKGRTPVSPVRSASLFSNLLRSKRFARKLTFQSEALLCSGPRPGRGFSGSPREALRPVAIREVSNEALRFG